MIELRPYQHELLDHARVLLREKRRSVLIQAPTGSGKTALTAVMLQTAASKGLRACFGVHRQELVNQSAATFDAVGLKYGIISPHHGMNRDAQIQIASIPTWIRRVNRLPPFDLIVWDECHHTAAKSWATLHRAYPKAYHVGLSATPQRLSGEGLRDFFGDMVCGPSTQWLIDNNYLCKIRYFVPNVPAMTPDGKTALVGDAISVYKRLAMGRRAIYFCADIAHSKDTAEAFNAAGVRAAHIDGEIHFDDRFRIMRAFRRGEIDIVTNASLVGEGVDVPGVECIGMLRKTESLTNFLQWIGRGLRIAPGKQDCIVLDHVNNRMIHGDPAQLREWSLDGVVDIVDGKPAPSKRCCICYAVTYSGATKCPDCGHVFVSISRAKLRQVDGDLEEVAADIAATQARTDQGMAKTLEGLIALGRMRGYANPLAWASAVLEGRNKSKRKAPRAQGSLV